MLFAADIGNSSISFGVFDDGGRLLLKSKVEAVKARSADEYAVLFRDILNLYRFDPANIRGGIVCSVVSPLTGTVCAAIGRLFGIRPMEVGPGVKTGLNIKIDLQAQLGADIVANAVARRWRSLRWSLLISAQPPPSRLSTGRGCWRVWSSAPACGFRSTRWRRAARSCPTFRLRRPGA